MATRIVIATSECGTTWSSGTFTNRSGISGADSSSGAVPVVETEVEVLLSHCHYFYL